MERRKTAGELSLKAASDNTKYDPLEIGYALCDDVVKQLYICAERHEKIFNEDEFFLCLFIASDPLIKGVRRHKYAAFLHMPSPRPNQSCYLYNKKTQEIKRLWTLPNPLVMAKISEMPYVSPQWQMTKGWCDAFYEKSFWDHIRSQNNISHLSEHEYLDSNREELIKSGCKESESVPTDAFDFSKVTIEKIIDTKTAIVD